MLINLSNHPSEKWSKEQLQKAAEYGEIVDIPFPQVSPTGDMAYIQNLANQYLEQIMATAKDKKTTVHLMGEMNFTYCLVELLRRQGIPCVASTTQRNVVESPDGQKTSVFEFVQFRPYFAV